MSRMKSPLANVARTLILIFLVHCSPKHSDPLPLDLSRSDPADTTRKSSVCFPGEKSQPTCFDQMARMPLPIQMELYQYPDPETDPDFPKSFDPSQYRAPDRLLDLRLISGRQPLSEHFKRAELMAEGPTRGYFGVFSPAVLAMIDSMRAKIGKPLTITGGFRSPGRNAQLEKSAKFSRHTYGDGIDFRVPGISYSNLEKMCKEFGADFALVYTDHIHCDWRNTPLDSAFFPTPIHPPTQVSQKLILQSIKSSARIVRDGPTLSISMFSEDPESEPYVEWTLIASDGTQTMIVSPTISVPDEVGNYIVQAYVGLQFHLEEVIQVP